MSTGEINPTELAAALISRKSTFKEGIEYLQDLVEGSLSVLILTSEGIYAARDKLGRTPIILGKKTKASAAPLKAAPF